MQAHASFRFDIIQKAAFCLLLRAFIIAHPSDEMYNHHSRKVYLKIAKNAPHDSIVEIVDDCGVSQATLANIRAAQVKVHSPSDVGYKY